MSAAVGLAQMFRSLRHRPYRHYISAQLVSLTGSWVQTAALTWLAYAWTDTSLWPALLMAAQVVPMGLFSITGGWLADRFPRRRLILLTQTGQLMQALLLAAAVLTGWREPGILLVVSFLLGLLNALDNPARLAFVIDLVGREDLPNAIALNALTFNLARMIGPAFGAVLLLVAGPAGCFAVNALTFVPVLVVLMRLRLPERLRPAASSAPAGTLSYLLARPQLLVLLAMAAGMAFFGWPLVSLLPALADRRLEIGQSGCGWLLSALGAGALLAALLVANLNSGHGRLLALGGGVLSAALGLAGLSWATTLGAGLFFAALCGLGLILFLASGQTAMQLGADEHNRGRLMGLWLTVLAIAHPIGHLGSGWLADRWGVTVILSGQALGLVLLGLLLALVGLVLSRWERLGGRNGTREGQQHDHRGPDQAQADQPQHPPAA